MKFPDPAYTLLQQTRQPLNYTQIAKRALAESRNQLRQRLRPMPPDRFAALISERLLALGFEETPGTTQDITP